MRIFLPALVLLVAGSAVGDPIPVTTVARSGAGVDPDTVFGELRRPVVLPHGNVLFGAWLTGSAGDQRSLWAGSPIAPAMFCREGDPYPPAGPDVTLLCPETRAGSDSPSSGTVRSFTWDFLQGGDVDTSNDTVRATHSGGSVTQVAREGEPAPGTDAVFDHVSNVETLMNTAGRVAFSQTLRGGTPLSGLWSGAPGSLSLVAAQGDSAPGLGGQFSLFVGPLLDPDGVLVFEALSDEGGDGLWRARPGDGPSYLAGTGTPDPAGPRTIASILAHSVSRTGDVAFKADLDNGDSGVWVVGGPRGLHRIAAVGDPAPDLGDFTGFGAPFVGGHGDVCFEASTTIGASGAFCELDGELEVVARSDDAHPELAAGETLGEIVWGPIVNYWGQVLFVSWIPTVSGIDVAWWRRDVLGNLHLVVREGSELEVSPLVVQTVETLDQPDGLPPFTDGGRASALNDRGEIVFLAEMTDGSQGIFLVRPEPRPAADPFLFGDGFESGSIAAWSGS